MERDYYLAFSAINGIGPVRFRLLLDHFGSAGKAWKAGKADLKMVLGERLAEKADRARGGFSVEGYLERIKKEGIDFLALPDRGFPKILRETKNPPFVLYVRYSKEIYRKDKPFNLNNFFPAVAVVGTRRVTGYGEEVTRLFVKDLVLAGFTIVSGLALGVDSLAHQGAIENSGKTIAVLGSGCDLCYPVQNQSLYNSIIAKGGCIISQFPLGQKPSRGFFPRRNAVIAGLSQAVLVTEGARDSGSLITANHALKNNRKVFAVPGPITSSLSEGPYKLIARGAKLVTSAKDILDDLGIKNNAVADKNKKRTGTKEEREILMLLENEPLHFDEIIKKTALSPSKLGSILSIMELKGMVRGLDEGLFSIAR
ncbi:DNA-processing protein DprA [Patescibacteria group bacterium]|nr:DNA-processing protein DprA [Patescibacteria group bacterium]MCL5010420.1 DNA-processing protein DprA [Patescibacteria group bacterium]